MVPPICVFLAKHSLVEAHDISSLEVRVFRCLFVTLTCKTLSVHCVRRCTDDSRAGDGSKTTTATSQVPLPRLVNGSFLCTALCNANLLAAYGMTEMTLACALPNLSIIERAKPGNAGTLVPMLELKVLFSSKEECAKAFLAQVVDPSTEQELPLGSTGEIHMRGPTVMKGYLNRFQATEETVDKDGWLHTGLFDWLPFLRGEMQATSVTSTKITCSSLWTD